MSLGESAEEWLKILPYLEKSYRVIIPDMIRFDYHNIPLPDYNSEFFVDILGKFIKNLKIGKLHLIDSGFGSRVAVEFASEHKNRLEKLILVSPEGSTKQSTPDLDAYIMSALYPNELSQKNAFNLIESSDKKLDDKIFDEYGNSFSNKFQFITIPTLIIWGSDDPVIPINYVDEFVSSIQDCQFFFKCWSAGYYLIVVELLCRVYILIGSNSAGSTTCTGL